MPRRVFTYPDLPHFATINLISCLSVYVPGLGILVFFTNLIVSLRKEKPALATIALGAVFLAGQ